MKKGAPDRYTDTHTHKKGASDRYTDTHTHVIKKRAGRRPASKQLGKHEIIILIDLICNVEDTIPNI